MANIISNGSDMMKSAEKCDTGRWSNPKFSDLQLELRERNEVREVAGDHRLGVLWRGGI
jgi:hypothetical protein